MINNKRREFLKDIVAQDNELKIKDQLGSSYVTSTVMQAASNAIDADVERPAIIETTEKAGEIIEAPIDELKSELPPKTGHKKQTSTERYFQDLADDKLNDEEVVVIYYASDTARYRLGVGWKTDDEVQRIRGWEDLNELSGALSTRYEQAMSRLDLRKLTEVSEHTSGGNPRQVTLVEEMRERLLELPEEFFDKCSEITRRVLEAQERAIKDEIPF